MNHKKRVEKLEQERGNKDEKIIVIRVCDDPKLEDEKYLESVKDDYRLQFPDKDIVFVEVVRKELKSRGQAEIEDI